MNNDEMKLDNAKMLKLEIKPSECRTIIHSFLTNQILYIGIPIYLLSLIFLDESSQTTAFYFMVAYTLAAFFFSVWLFVFDRHPRLSSVKIALKSKGVEVSLGSNETTVNLNETVSYEISGLLNKKIVLSDSDNNKVKISYYLFNPKQRNEFVSHISGLAIK
ncbi:hypothetical protein ISG33_08315 [Glaciecola sp. MH2013]|uniref:hypothetical protein n=1 Tax=Glaciecola sp. MH2013 TaxID=2785524 RepID=UPI00189DDEA6|nr:hypothetical protein [Glaciecola sp. MH2013]MBF7073397.1 hypothetical protein [Glaciecola sp. MH2013]